MLDSKMNQYCPSLQASAALYTSMRMIISKSTEKAASVWTKALEENTGYKSADLKNCSEAYCTLTHLILKSDKHGIMDKFAKPECLEVLRIVK